MKSTIQLSEFNNITFTVEQFVKKVNDEYSKFYQNQDYGKLVRDRGKNREIKKFIEEILPLQKYLIFRLKNGMIDESIKWENGSQKGMQH